MKDFEQIKEYIKGAQVVHLDPELLKPHQENDFSNVSGKDWQKFVQSIREFGVIHPIICDMSGRVLSGMQRTRACQELAVKVPAYRIPNVSKEVARHIVIMMNLATRRIPAEEFHKYWVELYGEEVQRMLSKGETKNAVIEKISKKSGVSTKVTARQVETVIHNRLRKKYDSIDKLDQIPPQSRARLKQLAKKASTLLTHMDTLQAEYVELRREMRSIVRLEILDLPEIQIQLHEDEVAAVTGAKKVTINKSRSYVSNKHKGKRK